MKSYLNAAAFSMFLGSEQNDVSWRMDCLKKFVRGLPHIVDELVIM